MTKSPGRTTQGFLALAFFIALLGAALLQSGPHTTWTPSPGRHATPEVVLAAGSPTPTPGIEIHLAEGQPPDTKAEANPVAAGTWLPVSEVARLVKNLPPMAVTPTDKVPFAHRAESLPPPRTGETVHTPFPPPAMLPTPAVASGPLTVLRHAPEGSILIVPQMSITFSQPMVPITGLADLAAKGVPAQLTPQPPGQWRWLGPQTLVYDGKPRFPMATEYTVVVPAGTRSATGATLSQAATWTFKTPPPRLMSSYPTGNSQPLEPKLFVAFDQDVDPDAVLATTSLKTGHETVAVRRLTGTEVAADPELKALSQSAQPGRWLAFQATTPLQPAHGYLVSIGPGTPSLEGPLKTSLVQTFSFRTYDPLDLVSYSGDHGPISPDSGWYLNFNNELDRSSFQKSWVHVEPALPEARLHVNGSTISISGLVRGRTTYRVTVDPPLRDRYAQTLGHPVSVSIEVGPARPSLAGLGGPFFIADPNGKPSWTIMSVNYPQLRLRMYRVGPDDWQAFSKYMMNWRDQRNPPPPPGQQVVDRVIDIQGAPDEPIETHLDLSEGTTHGFGQLFVDVQPLTQPVNPWEKQAAQSWVQVTHIGLDATADSNRMVAWATRLADGQPSSDVELTLWPRNVTARTADDGTATLPLPPQSAGMLLARQGDDLALLPQNPSIYGGPGAWQRYSQTDSLAWFVFDDRGMYRPKEEVHVKGWVRRHGAGTTGDVGGVSGTVDSIDWSLTDARGNQVLKGHADVSPLGGFDTHFTLPDAMNLGTASLSMSARPGAGLGNTTMSHPIQVQEFRRPEFEVAAQSEGGPYYLGDTAMVSVDAHYYAGGALPAAPVNWSVSASATSYSPPGHEAYSFGTWTPWWGGWEEWVPGVASGTAYQTFQSRTDGNGHHILAVTVLRDVPAHPVSISATANVQDVNRQSWGATAAVLVHPSKLYVGLHSDRTFVQGGQPLPIRVLVCDVDGKTRAGRQVSLHLARRVYQEDDEGQWRTVETDVQEKTVTSASDAVSTEFHPSTGGMYSLQATVEDDKGRPNQSELTLWVAGETEDQAKGVAQQKVLLIPDRQTYQPGQTAEVLVSAPFAGAEGLVSLRRSGIIRTERIHLKGNSYTLKIPIDPAWLPNVDLQVDLVGQSTDEDTGGTRPAFAGGSLTLPISTRTRQLTVDASAAPSSLEPGGKTAIHLKLTDADGHPVSNAEAAVVVVDEAVLALTGYQMADPMATFYAQREAGATDYHSRSQIVLDQLSNKKKDERLQEEQGLALGGAINGKGFTNTDTLQPSAPMAKAAAREEASNMAAPTTVAAAPPPPPAAPQYKLRTNLNPLALFAGRVHTDRRGTAVLPVKLPDNLTRYRVMVVAVAGDKQFGKGESHLVARLPMMVRPSAPRFLNMGDVFELPVVIQNQTDHPMQVEVAVRGNNVHLPQGQGKGLTVPANNRVEVRFPAEAVEAGTARFQIAAAAGKWTDAAEISLPVWTPATSEAFAAYGVLDNGAVAWPVQAPGAVFPQYGGLEVTTSSTALASLTDALLYLEAYPFECAEQVSSRVMAVAALKDVLTAFHAEGLPSQKAMIAAMDRDLSRLCGLQNYDGGFGLWYTGEASWPFISIHVAHALERAREKGFKVPDNVLQSSVGYLQTIDQHIPSWYGQEERRALQAYAAYVLWRMGKGDVARAHSIVADGGLDHLSLEAVGWLMPLLKSDRSMMAEIHRELASRVSETTADAHFVTHYDDGEHLLLASDRRVDAVLLESLIGDDPKSDLIPKLVNGLLDHRTRGHWESTQENCWVLLALDRYFNTYEKVTPDFISRVWLGSQFAGEHAFKGHTTERHQIDVPMQWLVERPGEQRLIVGKTGPGRLYYRIGMKYAPKNLNMPAADYGFTVQRVYQAVDHPGDVHRDADGVWHVKAGAKVRVKLTMVATGRRYHVALVDPLPAGLEAMNPALAVTGTIPPQNPQEFKGRGWGWWWQSAWYEHQNLRDERAEAFTSLLWDGVYTYVYTCRATTPGRFVVPPAKAEEMYHPETFGRSASDRLVVE